jgi:hypothetical protein
VNNDRPACSQLYLVRGDTYRAQFDYCEGPDEDSAVPVPVTGQVWRHTVRHGLTDAVLLALSSADGSILLDADGTTGRVKATNPTSTAALPVGTHKFDWEQTVGGVTETLWTGEFVIAEDQSR